MNNILLVCSAGMSTSLLVSKMEKVAKEKNIDAHIWAVGTAGFKDELSKADVVLLGPQVRFMQSQVKKLAGEKPVEVIDMRSYGKVDGAAVLDQALKLIKQ
jgi:PTS system cellobiose-specific IIB component